MIEVGDLVRVKPTKAKHPWRSSVYSVAGRKGRVKEIREVMASDHVPDGKIYEVEFNNGRKRFTKGFPSNNLKPVLSDKITISSQSDLTTVEKDVKHTSKGSEE